MKLRELKVKKLKKLKNKTMMLPINGHEFSIRFISGAKVDVGAMD